MPQSFAPGRTVYELDASDRVVHVNEGWLQFALENDAPQLTREAVLGRPLWRFISCPETRGIYSMLFRRVREQQHAIEVPYRCDAPDKRRFMVATLNPLPDGGIRITNQITRTEPRSPEPWYRLSRARSDELIVQCGWCKRVLLTSGEWVEVESATALFGFESDSGARPISHGICPACEAIWYRELGVSGV